MACLGSSLLPASGPNADGKSNRVELSKDNLLFCGKRAPESCLRIVISGSFGGLDLKASPLGKEIPIVTLAPSTSTYPKIWSCSAPVIQCGTCKPRCGLSTIEGGLPVTPQLVPGESASPSAVFRLVPDHSAGPSVGPSASHRFRCISKLAK
jgi:hypothetical protein